MYFTRTTFVGFLMLCASSVIADDSVTYKTAKEQGVTTCLAQIKKVGNFIIKENSHASHDIWNSKNVDKRMFSSFLVKGYSDGDSHVSIVVGPDQTGNCYAEYNETSFWPKSCSVLREETFSVFKFSGSMKSTSIVLKNEDDSVNIYMTPQDGGKSCLTTKREVIYY